MQMDQTVQIKPLQSVKGDGDRVTVVIVAYCDFE